LYGEAPEWQRSIQRKWRVFSKETNFAFAIFLLVLCFSITILWRLLFPSFYPDLWPEMGGMTLDVLFILIIFAFFEHGRSRSQFIDRQKETIDDYKRWDDPEARVRIAGAIRRLNRESVFSVDFSGAQISDFSFPRSGIGRLTGSRFYDGSWGEPLRETGVTLKRVVFDHVNCKEVEFSPYDPFEALSFDMPRYAKFEDCSFRGSDLRKAKFNGASLAWSAPPPDTHYEVVDEDDDGSPCYAQTTYGPFDRADLTGVSFRGCRFTNADFRGGQGLLASDFFRATGLEKSHFDDEETKAAVLKNAARED
jgi:uncharacterized protein YjbI with pentapeptide repeats